MLAAITRKLFDQLNAVPGVRSATLASYSPFGGSTSINDADVQGYTPKQDEDMDVETVYVAPKYPETFGISLLQGRPIGLQDAGGAPLVAMVNETLRESFSEVRARLATDLELVGQRRQPTTK